MLFNSGTTLVLILASVFWMLPKVWRYFSRLHVQRKHGCEPPRFLPQKDPFFGLDVALRMFRSYDEGQRSTIFQEQHREYGNTFQSVALGKTRIFTIDPDNLRGVFSTNFTDWGVEPLRLPAWESLLGKGVMNADGAFWRHSRDMVQPLFRREQISHSGSFDIHVRRLLSLLPEDGSTVDLQPLFARLVLDFTSDFLFGDSFESLTPNPSEDAMNFLDAFHEGQAQIGKRTQLPYLISFTQNKKYWSAVKVVHDMADSQVCSVKAENLFISRYFA